MGPIHGVSFSAQDVALSAAVPHGRPLSLPNGLPRERPLSQCPSSAPRDAAMLTRRDPGSLGAAKPDAATSRVTSSEPGGCRPASDPLCVSDVIDVFTELTALLKVLPSVST